MKKLAILGTLIAAMLQSALAIQVDVSTSWVDGQQVYPLKATDLTYIADHGKDYTRTLYDDNPSSFYARVLPGHEITQWSWGTSACMPDADKYPNIIMSSSAALPWQSNWNYLSASVSTVYLGVHQNWFKYTIYFNGNGGSGSMSAQSGLVYNVSKTLAANTFTQTGYDMVGWSKDAKATTASFTDKASVTGASFGLDYTNKSVTLYAVWQPKTITITLDAQSESVSPKTLSAKYAAAYTLPTPTRTGYTFIGWYTTAEGGSKIPQEGTSSFASNVTLYAHWTIKTYTLNAYKSGAGDGSVSKEPAGNVYNYGTDVQLNATPATGSRFVKWSDGETGATRTVTVISNMTYTAQFEKEQLTVRFYYYDAQGNHVYKSESVEYGKSAMLPSDAAFQDTINHYPKHHWTGEWSSSYTNIRQDENIEAKYEWNAYTIRFSAANKTSGSMSDQSAVLSTEKLTLKSNGFSRTGYDFAHWYCALLDRTFVDGEVVDHLTTENGVTFNFEAVWEPKTYTVTLNPNGDGATVDPASVPVTYNVVYGKLPKPEREGYSFDGWYTSSYGGEKIAEDAKVTRTNDHTLYAHWTAKTYTVTTAGEHGALKGTVPTAGNFGTALSLLWGSDSAEGYEFNLVSVKVFSGTDASGNELATWTSGTSGTFTMSGTYYPNVYIEVKYAKEPKSYTLTFEAYPGTTKESFRKIQYGSAYGELPEATRVGYDFGGWFASSTFAGEPVTKDTVLSKPENVTVYAKWTAKDYCVTTSGINCSVTAPNVGTFDQSLAIVWSPEEEQGYTFTLKEVAVFAGAAITDKRLATYYSGTSAKYTMDYEYASDIHIHGDYERTANTYTVLFETNGGSTCYPKQVTFASTYASKLPTTTRDGYKFLGWYLGEELITEEMVVATPDNHTLSAKWRQETYTIRFHGGEGSLGEMDPLEIGIVETGTLTLNAFTKTGYTFLGWASSEDNAKKMLIAYEDGATLKRKAYPADTNVELYAIWIPNKYTVAFFANGGYGEMEEQEFTYDEEPKALLANEFKRKECKFLGWSTDPLKDYCLLDKEAVANLTDELNGIVMLFAKWERIDSFDSDLSKWADCAETVPGKYKALDLQRKPGTSAAKKSEDAIVGESSVMLALAPEELLTTSTMTCDRICGPGTLTFYYKTEINNKVNGFEFSATINGVQQTFIESQTVQDWQLYTLTIKAGEELTELEWAVSIPINKSITDYALVDGVFWKPESWDTETVALTYRLNDGTVAPKDIITNVTCKVGSTIDAAAIPPLPEKDGVSALGWSTNRVASVAMDMTTWVVPAADTQLYAVWKASENPVPTEGDRPVIGEGFKFTTDPRFDYVIWKKNDLMDADWTKHDTVTGNGQPVALPMFVDQQGFFKVEVIQRGSK